MFKKSFAKPAGGPKKTARTNRHVDLTARIDTLIDDQLFSILDKLAVPPFLLILDQVQDPHNLGACLRSADAAGVHAVVAPRDRSVSMTDTVRKIACGAAEHVPFVQVTNLARIIDQLKKRNIWVVGTTDQATKSIYDIDFKGPLAIVMGSEGEGIRRLTADKCDFLASIPMLGSVESLNVSVATGVTLFEAVRQRKALKQ